MATNRSNSSSQDVQAMPQAPCFLSHLGEDLGNVTYSNLSLNTLGVFSQTATFVETATAFLRLLPSAIDAEPESYKIGAQSQEPHQTDETKLAALAILQRHPELLFREGTVIDHYGRKVFGSPYRIFLGTGDVWALKQIHDTILSKVPEMDGKDGVAQAQEAFQQQFPGCTLPSDPEKMNEEMLYDDRNKDMVKRVIEQLKKVAEKIALDPCTNGQATLSATTDAVAELCAIFKPKNGEVIRTGLHLPIAIMEKISETYDTNFTPWTEARLAFFSREVIGPAEEASTAVDGQCIKYGLKNLDMQKGPDRRDGLFCLHPKGIPPELSPIRDKLGKTIFVDPYDGESCVRSKVTGQYDWFNKNGRGAARTRMWRVVATRSWAVLVNLWKTKAETYCNYYSAKRKEVNTPSL